MKKLLSLLIPGFAACAGHVETDAVESAPAMVVPSPSPKQVPRVVQMAPWTAGMCGLFDDQQVRCWGYDAPHEVWDVKGLTGVAFAAAEDSGPHGRICAISAAGTVACVVAECVVRGNAMDCLPRDPPYEVNVAPPAVSVSLDDWGGAALRADGTFQAWGAAAPRCVDPPPPYLSDLPDDPGYNVVTVPLALARPIVALDNGWLNLCLVTDDGRVYCAFTEGSDPQCAWPPVALKEVGSTTEVQDAIDVAVAQQVVCILHRTGHVTCYGPAARLGIGRDDGELLWAEVSGIDDAVGVAATTSSTCVIRRDGTLWCWGTNIAGELGPGPNISSDVDIDDVIYDGKPFVVASPQRMEGVENVRVVGKSDGYACAGEADGDIWCWGWPTGGTPYRIVVPPTR